MSKTFGNAIKQLSQAVTEQGKPTDIRYGKVISTSPLRVQISTELTLPQSVLVVPKSLTDHTVEVMIDNVIKPMTIRNALKVGDKVLLLRQQGGQSYIILDKI